MGFPRTAVYVPLIFLTFKVVNMSIFLPAAQAGKKL